MPDANPGLDISIDCPYSAAQLIPIRNGSIQRCGVFRLLKRRWPMSQEIKQNIKSLETELEKLKGYL
jgi:hypothetical protein